MKDADKAFDDALMAELISEVLREDGYVVNEFVGKYHRTSWDRAFFVTSPSGRKYVLKFNEN
ncbi:hypothetical protein MHB71_04750 [Paenibacillus sp. FSL H7-0940]|uniref:hypothetical protein n=1 Tax=Paenibacillus sp. FSL H7-0940 TaxID=2921443 RepID=UPI0030EF2035